MHGDDRQGLIPRTAYFLGVVARCSADAVAYPYRRLRPHPAPERQQGASPSARREHALAQAAIGLPRSDPGLAGRVSPAPQGQRGQARRDQLPVVAAQAAADQGLHALSAALTDPDPEVRIAALEALGALDAEQAGRMLADVLHDPDPQVRVAAAEVAARTGATAVVFSLILALDDAAAEVRAAAAHALERVTGERIDYAPDDPPAARHALIDELKRWWKARRLSELAAR